MNPAFRIFEDGDDTIRDLTALGAKRLVALARKVSRGESGPTLEVKARGIILDIKEAQQRRRRDARKAAR